MKEILTAEDARIMTKEHIDDIIERTYDLIMEKIKESIFKGKYNTELMISSSLVAKKLSSIFTEYGYNVTIKNPAFQSNSNDNSYVLLFISWEAEQ